MQILKTLTLHQSQSPILKWELSRILWWMRNKASWAGKNAGILPYCHTFFFQFLCSSELGFLESWFHLFFVFFNFFFFFFLCLLLGNLLVFSICNYVYEWMLNGWVAWIGWDGCVMYFFFWYIYKVYPFFFFFFFSILVKNAHAVLPQWDQICTQNGRFGA